MHQRELFGSCVPPFEVLDAFEQLRPIAERSSYRAQTADMLGMSPSRIVPAAISMGNEPDAHRSA
jgi:hypothetical protein